jgi:hypothetical protein
MTQGEAGSGIVQTRDRPWIGEGAKVGSERLRE